LNTDAGSGALEYGADKSKENVLIEHDGRAKTRTGFDPGDAPPHKREKFRRLNKWNDGMWAQERKSQNRAADDRRMTETVARSLGLGDSALDEALHIVGNMSMQFGQYSSNEVVLATCIIVAQRNGWINVERSQKCQGLIMSMDTSLDRCQRLIDLISRRHDFL
jgi:transcription initiation factor TFIIIB Brf1 subunit/transcription initiation factor TFIIB